MPDALVAELGRATLRRAAAADNDQIAAIWNHEVLWTDATTDTEPRDAGEQREWLERHTGACPALVAVTGDEVLAYGSLSPYRGKPAFRATVEDSVYVKVGARAMGLGRLVLGELLRLAGERRHHSVMARITADNEVSRRLHAGLGFRLVGIERETAFKLERWHDVALMQRIF